MDTTQTADEEAIEMTAAEIDQLVDEVLLDAGATLEELRAQANLGRFDTEVGRMAWFTIRGWGRG